MATTPNTNAATSKERPWQFSLRTLVLVVLGLGLLGWIVYEWRLVHRGYYSNGALHLKVGVKRPLFLFGEAQYHGKATYYRKDGTLMGMCQYLNGERHGQSYAYDNSGELLGVAGTYDHGEQKGLFQEWFPNGNLRRTWYPFSPHAETNMDGKEQLFFETGELSEVRFWKRGVLHGRRINYRPNGHEFRIMDVVNGKKHGQERYWDIKGELLTDGEWVSGKPWHGTFFLDGENVVEYRGGELVRKVGRMKWDGKSMTAKPSDEKNKQPAKAP